ncbi:MAG: hypothetical protein ACRC92_24070 [Peptostreptococcaceae bacterium]
MKKILLLASVLVTLSACTFVQPKPEPEVAIEDVYFVPRAQFAHRDTVEVWSNKTNAPITK